MAAAVPGVADAAALMQANMMAQAEIGLGVLTQQQADDLRVAQQNCSDTIDGRQYLYLLQIGGNQRLDALHSESTPPTCRLTPGQTLTGCRAIEYLNDDQYRSLKDMLYDACRDQMPTFADIMSGNMEKLVKALPIEKVSSIFSKCFKETLKRDLLPNVAAGNDEYQRRCTLALTNNFRIAFTSAIALEKRLAEIPHLRF